MHGNPMRYRHIINYNNYTVLVKFRTFVALPYTVIACNSRKYGIFPASSISVRLFLPNVSSINETQTSLIDETLSEFSRDFAEISWFSENPFLTIYIYFGKFQENSYAIAAEIQGVV